LPAKEWKIAGKSPKRFDTPNKVTGKHMFGIDTKLPGMLVASIRDCPVNGGKVKSFDASKVDGELLAAVKAASLVEYNAGDYVAYLKRVFHGAPEETLRTIEDWGNEEIQHGLALGRWAEMADPNFDFKGAFARFRAAYRPAHFENGNGSVRGSKRGEMIARCVVESGTSSLYSAIRDAAEEPVLREIAGRIAADEFRHFKLFFTHMERYAGSAGEPFSKWDRLRVAVTRFKEADDDEIASAYHAGNAVVEPYDRSSATASYGQRVFGFYHRRHVRRAGYMFAQAVGLAPEGLAAKLLTKVLWLIIWFRGRKFRPQLAGA